MNLIDTLGDKKLINAVVSELRKQFSRSINYIDARDRALSNKKGVRGGKRWDCANCGNDFSAKEIHVDHIDPVVPVTISLENMSLKEVKDRIFCDLNNLQVLCKDCHNVKTREENKERRRT